MCTYLLGIVEMRESKILFSRIRVSGNGRGLIAIPNIFFFFFLNRYSGKRKSVSGLEGKSCYPLTDWLIIQRYISCPFSFLACFYDYLYYRTNVVSFIPRVSSAKVGDDENDESLPHPSTHHHLKLFHYLISLFFILFYY